MFKRNNLYSDDGSLLTQGKSGIMAAGAFSQTTNGTTSGTPINMYDGNSTTLYTFCYTDGGAGSAWLKWTFDGKQKFKNVYVYLQTHDRTFTMTVKLQGSNDDSTWTELDTFTSTGANAVKYDTLLATNTQYKYIRVLATATGGGADCSIYVIQGVV